MTVTNPSSGTASAAPPMSFGGNGGFRRVADSAIVDLSASSKASRNPRLYIESDPSSSTGRTFYVYTDMPASTGDTSNAADLGLASGPSLDALTFRGTKVAASLFSGQFGGIGDYIAGSSLVKDTANLYHMYPCVTDGYMASLPTVAGVFHLTAPTASGPWTLAGQALTTIAGETGPTDNCAPVFFGGQWVMAFMSYPSSFPANAASRKVMFATAPSLNGPWTRGGSNPLPQGGVGPNQATGLFDVDNPTLFAADGRLWMTVASDRYTWELYEVSADRSKLWHHGPVLTAVPGEDGSPVWGGGSVFQHGGEMFATWQGILSSGSYYKSYGGKWTPGRIYVPLTPRDPGSAAVHYFYFDQLLATGTTFTYATLPAWVPNEAILADLHFESWDTGVISGNPFTTLDSSVPEQTFSGDTYAALRIFTGFQNKTLSERGLVPIPKGGANRHKMRLATNSAVAPRANLALLGYWRLP